MSLDRKDFTEFFAALHGGHAPFAWQERLLDAVVESGRWPDRVIAPTGAGKTAVIDAHVFAHALSAATSTPRPPRRLAMVVDRRVLVDDQHEYARTLAERLLHADRTEAAVLAEVAALLWQARRPDRLPREGAALEGVSPLVVARLRGGAPPSRTWRDHPEAVAVLCATPDMWGSRLLFRGYGSSNLAWPREAGLLAVDSAVVVDEAHLARQLLHTARRVAQLVGIAERDVTWRALQVVEATATPPPATTSPGQPAETAVGVTAGDLDHQVLGPRLTRPKPVRLVPVKDWANPRPGSRPVTALADAVMDLLPTHPVAPDGPAATVGCFVNTVARAVAVADELRGRQIDGRPMRVVMICGQVRPIDLDRVRAAHPGLLEVAGDPAVDVVVSTQSLEVGVDLDLAGLVTELADGSALAQRAGRVNRRGLRDVGPVVVTVPESGPDGGAASGSVEQLIPDRMRSGPYGAVELRAALTWLNARAADPAGLAPWTLREHRPPPAAPGRMLYQRPELAEAWHWARTSDDLAADPELDLWLAEDFAADTSVGLVVRDQLPADPADALRLVSDLPPRAHEVFTVPYRTARATLRDLHSAAQTGGETDGPAPALIRVRGQDVDLLAWQDDGSDHPVPRLRPGDLVVVDSGSELFTTTDAAGAAFSPPVVVPVDQEGPQPSRGRAPDVLEAAADLPARVWAARRTGGVVLRIEPSRPRATPADTGPPDPRFAALADALSPQEEPLTDGAERAIVREWLAHVPAEPARQAMVAATIDLLAGPASHSEIIVHRDPDGRPARVLVIDRRRAAADEAVRQVWTPRAGEVTLQAHQQAVAARAAAMGATLGLGPELVDALTQAGAHHDDGKQDPRFQLRLGAPVDRLLAKSRAGTTAEQARRNEHRAGLPGRWRHEQRSVAHAWASLRDAGHPDPLLAARLVGTSHGHGRSTFPHTTTELLLPHDEAELRQIAQNLFDTGGWDELIEVTHQRYGVWGCAYLEAVLRAADGQVSGEGS